MVGWKTTAHNIGTIKLPGETIELTLPDCTNSTSAHSDQWEIQV